MAFEGMSFGLFTDAGLTTGFSYTKQLLENTDLSGEPQTFSVYLGSNAGAALLQAASDPGVDQITLTPTDIMPEWDNATAYIIGDRVQTTADDGYIWRCTTAGTSGGSEPSWNAGGIGSTTIDNTVIWTKYSLKHEPIEIKLALSSGALGAATPGAALDIGTDIDGGVGNAIHIWIRVTSAVTTAGNNTGHEELDIYINEVVES